MAGFISPVDVWHALPGVSPTLLEVCRCRLGLDSELDATPLRRWMRIMQHEFGTDNEVVKTSQRVLQTVLEHAAETEAKH